MTGKAVRLLRLPVVNYGGSPLQIVRTQQNDANSRIIKAVIFDDTGYVNLDGYTVTLACIIDGEKKIYGDINNQDNYTVEIIYKEGSQDEIDITYARALIPAEVMLEVGSVESQLCFTKKDGTKLTTQSFYILVDECPTGGIIGDDKNYDILSKIIMNEEERIDAEKNRVTAEAERETAEATRKQNEKARVDAETKRNTQEKIRQDNELVRVNAETQRIKDEAVRTTAEQKRTLAESDRVSKENTRQANETKRTEAEIKRIEDEVVRTDNETTRVSAEQGRVTAEVNRENQEKIRQTKETERQTAETSRVQAESKRVATFDTMSKQYAENISKVEKLTQPIDNKLAGGVGVPSLEIDPVTGGLLVKNLKGEPGDGSSIIIKGQTVKRVYFTSDPQEQINEIYPAINNKLALKVNTADVVDEINVNVPKDNRSDLVASQKLASWVHENAIFRENDLKELINNNKAAIPKNLSQLTADSTHRVVTDTQINTWNNKSNFSGNYNDLSNKPTIPSKTSQLTNDSRFIQNGETVSLDKQLIFTDTVNPYIKMFSDDKYLFIQAYDSKLMLGDPLKGLHIEMATGNTITKNNLKVEGSLVYKGKELVDLIYPVGSIYMSVNSTNPETLFTGTKWSKIEGKFLLGSSSSYGLGTSGGESTHKLTTNEMPSHTHTFTGNSSTTSSDGAHTHKYQKPYMTAKQVMGGSGSRFTNFESVDTTSAGAHTHTVTASGTNSSTGGGVAHNNMPPYVAVNIWKRTS